MAMLNNQRVPSCCDPKIGQHAATQNGQKRGKTLRSILHDAPCRRCLACGFCTLTMKGSTLSKNVAILPASAAMFFKPFGSTTVTNSVILWLNFEVPSGYD